MACTQSKVVTYEVYEYDAAGVTYKSDKKVEFDLAKMGSYNRSEATVLAFFQQMFDTINTPSGFSALFDGQAGQETDIITIRWRTPQWKLVKV